MKSLKYSPDALEKLQQIKKDVAIQFGEGIAKKIIYRITSSLRELEKYEYKGPAANNIMGIPTDYRYLYVQHNYIFYRISNNDILIIDIFNEREDFMWKLFGIKQVVDPSEDE